MYGNCDNNPLNNVVPTGLSDLPVKKVHTPLNFRPAALIKVKTENGQATSYRIKSATDIVKIMINAEVTGNKITHFQYVGHGDYEGGGIGWVDRNGLTGIYTEKMRIAPTNRVFTFESLQNVINNSFTSNAKIELLGCYTAMGPDSIAYKFKELLPESEVYGYTGKARIQTMFGINWAMKDKYIKIKLTKKDCNNE